MKIEKIQKRLEKLENEIVSLKKEVLAYTLNETKKKAELFSPPISQPATPIEKPKSREWELFLGGNLLGKFGLLSILLASVWFIKFAFDNRWVNESGRILIGLSIGFGVSFAGLRLAGKNFRVLPESVLGAGFSIVYLSLFGAYYYYDLFSLSETFLYLSLLSVFSSGLAYWIRREILYIFGLIGSVLSPILISQGENSYRFLFGYLFFLNMIHFLITRKIPWIVSSFLLLISNFTMYYFWAEKNINQSGFIVPFLFINATYLLFLYEKIFLFPKLSETTKDTGAIFTQWNSIFFPIFLVLNSLCFGFTGYYQIREFYPNTSAHFFLYGALLLALLIHFTRKKSKFVFKQQDHEIFETVQFGLLLGFTFTSLSDFSEDNWLTFSWISFAGTLSLLSVNLKNIQIRMIAIIFWMIALFRLYFLNHIDDVDRIFLLNERFGLYILASLFLFGTYYIQKNKTEFELNRGFIYMGIVTAISGTLVDVYHTVHNEHYRNLGYSYVLAFYSSLFLFFGFKYSFKSLRIAGIIVSMTLVGKLFLYDIWTMSMIVRIIAGFTLGIGFVLISVYYQKFKDKIAISKNVGGLFLFFVMIFGSPLVSSLKAETINTKGYRYYKEIQISKIDPKKKNTEEESIVYGKIKLDEDIVRHSGINDRRILHNGRVVPFISRNTLAVPGDSGEIGIKLLFEEKIQNNRNYVLKLPNISSKSRYSSIFATGLGEYEVKGSIYLGKNPEDLRFGSEFTVYSYAGEDASNQIHFEARKEDTYVRIETKSPVSLTFSKATYKPIIEVEEFKRVLERSDLEFGFNADTKSSVFYFRNPMKIPVHRVVLHIKEKKYQRDVTVFYKNSSKEFESLTTHTILNKPNTKSDTNLVFLNPIASELKFEIYDGDDLPLTLEKMEIFILQEEIVFPINLEELEEDSNRDFKIFYGNPYSQKAEFDFSKTFSESVSQQEMIVTEEHENENFGYSITEPPVSTWILRAFFFLGLTVLTFLTYKVFRFQTSAASKE
ncbi:DUF2339 domain-containing protein [Leptospira sp. WS92.C1]